MGAITPEKKERNDSIYRDYLLMKEKLLTMSDMVSKYGISQQRIYEIISPYKKGKKTL